nr:hypothetical protein GCM10025699_00560 [Microbacterium flavescens]BFF12525.1 hypothetical protein GCM10025699_38280 [Microbacterium flavescens]
MNFFIEAFAWIFSPERLSGSLPLPTAIVQHLAFTFGSVLIASVIAIPAGWAIGHTGRGREFAVFLSGAARALPSLGLIVLLYLVFGVSSRPRPRSRRSCSWRSPRCWPARTRGSRRSTAR